MKPLTRKIMIESRIQILALLVLLLAGCSKENPIDKYKYWQGAGDSGETVERDKTTVEIKNNGIYVNGEQFYIKGAALNGKNLSATDDENPFWAEAVKAGANSIRLYSSADLPADNTKALACLDKFYEQHIFVAFGLQVARECDGADYSSDAIREYRINTLKKEVDKYKGHPAILFWCIGNEVDCSTKADGTSFTPNVNVWKDINTIAEYIKEVDGRPTSTAITGIWSNQTTPDDIKQYCTALDILCVNNYEGNIQDLYSSWQNKNFGIPYIVSEFGIRGTWDSGVPKTSFGSLIEPTANEKAETYGNLYNQYILSHKENGCLGSYVFLWGWQTHGAVLTWYTMFDQFSNAALPSVDMMTYLWSGSYPENRAPVVASRTDLTIDGKSASDNVSLSKASSVHTAKIVATDPEGDKLKYEWRIIKDENLGFGVPMSGGISGLFSTNQTDQNSIGFTAPSEAGNYRLIVYVRDLNHKKASCAVLPFEVK